MKQLAAVPVLVLAFVACSCAAADETADAEPGVDRPAVAAGAASGATDDVGDVPALDEELTAVYQRFLDGLRDRDTLAYRDALVPEYIHVTGDTASVTFGRTARMRWDQEQLSGITIFDAIGCRAVRYGDAAVGPCWFRQAGRADGVDYDALGVSLTTFVFTGGTWRIAATRPSTAGAGPDVFRRE